MTDKRPGKEDPFASLDIAEDADAAWGDDWESAFQSEENMFFSEGTESGPSPAAATEPDLADSLARSLESIPDTDQATAPTPASRLALPAFVSTFAAAALTYGRGILQRLLALPLFVRIPLFLLPAVLLLLVLATGRGPDAPAVPQTPSRESGETRPAPGIGIDDQEAAPEKVRKKWEFSSFFIPVETADSEQPVSFVQVDITLITVLDPQEAPPAEKEIPVRDMIYRFYKNIPAAELRRFSLARGEMNRKLRDWLRKEWPEAPIESIVFDRYILS